MHDKTDKRLRARQFRARLAEAMAARGVSQSALARRAGVDRSTISQLLKDQGARLPNAQLVGECAAALGVSADWLLSLTDRQETAADILANSLSLTEAQRALIDDQVFGWHREAAGYKIRHVPAGLPDMLKTQEMLEWEYAPHLGRSAGQAIAAAQERMAWMASAASDYEIALPGYELQACLAGEGYYASLPPELRRAQGAHLIAVTRQLYPRMRLYLFDARQLYSAPITIFGPLLAALYIGQTYIVFRDSERVRAMTEHFDHLVREATVSARQLPDHIQGLVARI